MPESDCYFGFSVLDSAARLGQFIEAQDSVVWQQQVTHEMGKLPAVTSFRASVALSTAWAWMQPGKLEARMAKCQTYWELGKALSSKDFPGNPDFIRKKWQKQS